MLCDVMDYRRLKIWYEQIVSSSSLATIVFMCRDLQRSRGATDISIIFLQNRLNDVKMLKAIVVFCVTRGAQIRNSLSRSCIDAFYWF